MRPSLRASMSAENLVQFSNAAEPTHKELAGGLYPDPDTYPGTRIESLPGYPDSLHLPG